MAQSGKVKFLVFVSGYMCNFLTRIQSQRVIHVIVYFIYIFLKIWKSSAKEFHFALGRS